MGAGWYFTSQLLPPNHSAPSYDIAVHTVTSGSVELERTVDTLRGGVFGLEWPGGNAIVGAITSTSDRTVTRTLERATVPLHRGVRVAMSSQVYWGDTQQSFGIPSQNVGIPSDVGPLPAWYVPGSGTDFVIVVHGYNGPITDGLRLVPTLARLGLPVLLIRYRNDAGAPPSEDHLLHLGDTEWRDLDAAVRWALSQGAHRLVLVGISMGGAMVEIFMQRSSLAGRVAALVLDSPMLGWDAVLRFQAERRHLPDLLIGPTELVIRLRIGFDVMSYDQVRDAAAVRVPTLLFQDGQETFVPPHKAMDFARARPDLVEYHFSASAGHTQEWNVDPEVYESTLSSFLVRKLAMPTPSLTS